MSNKKVAAKVQPKSTSKVATTDKVSLAEMLKQKAENANLYKVQIPVSYLLEFDPENPITETIQVLGSPRKVLKWNVFVDNRAAVANFMVGQISRLYQFIIEENLPEGISLDDKTQCVVVMTDKFTVNQRGQKNPNGSLGFLNLTPCTVSAGSKAEVVTGFQFAE